MRDYPYWSPYEVNEWCQGCYDPDPLFDLNWYYYTHCEWYAVKLYISLIRDFHGAISYV